MNNTRKHLFEARGVPGIYLSTKQDAVGMGYRRALVLGLQLAEAAEGSTRIRRRKILEVRRA